MSPLLASGQNKGLLGIIEYGRNDTVPISRPMPQGTVSFYFLLLETFALRALSCHVINPTTPLERSSRQAQRVYAKGKGTSWVSPFSPFYHSARNENELSWFLQTSPAAQLIFNEKPQIMLYGTKKSSDPQN